MASFCVLWQFICLIFWIQTDICKASTFHQFYNFCQRWRPYILNSCYDDNKMVNGDCMRCWWADWLLFVCLVQPILLYLLFLPKVRSLALPNFYARVSGVLHYQIQNYWTSLYFILLNFFKLWTEIKCSLKLLTMFRCEQNNMFIKWGYVMFFQLCDILSYPVWN